jgi:hypothetical protein
VPEKDRVGTREHYRSERIATTKTAFAALIGFVGAALLLASAWPWSLIGIAVATALFYVTMVMSTYNDRRFVAKWIRFEREQDPESGGRPGRILASTAAVMNVAPWDYEDAPATAWYGTPGDPGDLRIAEGVQRIAEERARLLWAVRHPYGVDWWSRRSIRVWLILRVRYLIGKPI